MGVQVRSIKKLLLLVLGLIALISIIACTGPAGPAGPQGLAGPAGAGDSQSGYDLTLLADGGTAKQLGSNRYEITLTGVHPNVLAFQNRPDRGFAYFEVEKLPALWPGMFQNTNGSPNVSMVSRDLNSNAQDSTAFSMGPPSRDESSGALTFDMSLLPGTAAPLESFTDASLFIDPTTWQWIKVGVSCGSAALSIIAAAVQGGADVLADLGAGFATATCISTLHDVGVIK